MTDFGKSSQGPTLVDLTAVANNATNINTVATNIADIQTIADEIGDGLVTSINSVLNNTLSLSGLTDTDIGTLSSTQDGYALSWVWDTNTSSGEWQPASATVSHIGDLDVTDPTTDGNGIQWDSTAHSGTGGYIPANFLFADGGGGNQTITTAKISDIASPTGNGNKLAVVNAAGTLIELSDTKTGNLTITGDLTVQGNTVTLNTSTLDVEDINITVAKNAPSAAAADGAGLTVDTAGATFTYANTGDKWTANKDLDVGTNKLFYSNVFSTIGDLPAASSYHGMFAHVHVEEAAYFAHGSNWVELAKDGEVAKTDTDASFTQVTADNLVMDANTISSTSGDITLDPTGKVVVAEGHALETTPRAGTTVDVRKADQQDITTSQDIESGVPLYRVTAASVQLTLDTTKVSAGDVIVIYAQGNSVDILNDGTNAFTTIYQDGETTNRNAAAVSAQVDANTLATITIVADGMAIVAGSGITLP